MVSHAYTAVFITVSHVASCTVKHVASRSADAGGPAPGGAWEASARGGAAQRKAPPVQADWWAGALCRTPASSHTASKPDGCVPAESKHQGVAMHEVSQPQHLGGNCLEGCPGEDDESHVWRIPWEWMVFVGRDLSVWEEA